MKCWSGAHRFSWTPFLSDMYISDLNLYLYPRNHLRSQTTLGLHTLVQIGFVHLQGLEMNTVGSGWMRRHIKNSSGFAHPSVRSHRRARSPASRISVVVVFSAVHFRNRRNHRIKQKAMSKEKVDGPERSPWMNQDEGDGTEMAPTLAVDLTAIVRHLKKFWELDWSDGAFL